MRLYAGIDILSVSDFMENQVQVLAYAQALLQRTKMRLQHELHGEEPGTAEQALEQAVFNLREDGVEWDDVARKLERPLSILLGYTSIMNLYLKPNKTTKCVCIGCTNNAIHTWSGHPTCDECATPSRQYRS